MKNKKREILLESGTNELEIVEFQIKDESYGINIAKVREIIKADLEIVPVPDAHPSISGVINLRGNIIPVIDLGKHLHANISYDMHTSRIIVAEFNQLVVGFWVTSVDRIHRLSWKEVERPSEMLQTGEGYSVGVIKIEGKILFLLDFEKIAGEINPAAGIAAQSATPTSDTDRASKMILVAEDSTFVKQAIVDKLTTAGYQVDSVDDGEKAWEKIAQALNSPGFKQINDYYNLLVTDIEMPRVDGLHLIKRIKDDPKLRKLPCIAFSSMISSEIAQKCKSVGSDGEIAKPDINELVSLVDEKVL